MVWPSLSVGLYPSEGSKGWSKKRSLWSRRGCRCASSCSEGVGTVFECSELMLCLPRVEFDRCGGETRTPTELCVFTPLLLLSLHSLLLDTNTLIDTRTFSTPLPAHPSYHHYQPSLQQRRVSDEPPALIDLPPPSRLLSSSLGLVRTNHRRRQPSCVKQSSTLPALPTPTNLRHSES